MVSCLPRSISDAKTVTIKFKRKHEYQKTEFTENIRPFAVWKAIRYLMKNSQLYKGLNIQINHNWLHNIYTNNSYLKEFLNQDVTSFKLPVMDDEFETVQQYGITDGVTLKH